MKRPMELSVFQAPDRLQKASAHLETSNHDRLLNSAKGWRISDDFYKEKELFTDWRYASAWYVVRRKPELKLGSFYTLEGGEDSHGLSIKRRILGIEGNLKMKASETLMEGREAEQPQGASLRTSSRGKSRQIRPENGSPSVLRNSLLDGRVASKKRVERRRWGRGRRRRRTISKAMFLMRDVIVWIFDWHYLSDAIPEHVHQRREGIPFGCFFPLLSLPSVPPSLSPPLLGRFLFRGGAVLVTENPSEIYLLRGPNSTILVEKEHFSRTSLSESALPPPPLLSLSIFISISVYSVLSLSLCPLITSNEKDEYKEGG